MLSSVINNKKILFDEIYMWMPKVPIFIFFLGLSEVIGGMGEDKLKKLMGDIIQTAERSDVMPHVRDGYIMTYIYLPSVFGQTFVQYVGPILPSILQVSLCLLILISFFSLSTCTFHFSLTWKCLSMLC